MNERGAVVDEERRGMSGGGEKWKKSLRRLMNCVDLTIE